MRLACYDPGSRHLGEVVLLEEPGVGVRLLEGTAGHVTVNATDEGLATLALRCASCWRAAGIDRVVLERVSGLGAGPDVTKRGLCSTANHLIAAARVGSLLQGVALALGIPVVTYPPRTARAGLKIKGKPASAEYVRERIEGWALSGEVAPEHVNGTWYHHAYDAALIGLWDVEVRARPAPQKGPRATRTPAPKRGKPRLHGTKYMRRGHPSDAAFEALLAERDAKRAERTALRARSTPHEE